MSVLIKRYANRKLYNTQTSRYITLKGIAELIDAGEDVRVIDNETGEDITNVALSASATPARGSKGCRTTCERSSKTGSTMRASSESGSRSPRRTSTASYKARWSASSRCSTCHAARTSKPSTKTCGEWPTPSNPSSTPSPTRRVLATDRAPRFPTKPTTSSANAQPLLHSQTEPRSLSPMSIKSWTSERSCSFILEISNSSEAASGAR